MTRDERRALSFVVLLLALAAGARVARREPPVTWPADVVDADSLEAAARERKEQAERRARPLRADERIDPNVAPEEELDRLPGVGPALARRIIAAREEGGPFRSLRDLTRVRGIGPSALQRLAPHLRLPAPPAGAGGAAGSEPAGPGGVGLVAELGPGVVPTVVATGAPTGSAGSAGSARSTGAGARAGGNAAPLDLNRATAAELEALPGIGPALAARIVAYRDSAGPFTAVDSLTRVRGIGPALLERLRPRLRVRP
ncbi:MAG TPA: helix-hairpin-helix domain-containing protein [Longimicrobiales bacterium]